ncbi:zinc-binding alcohol dehydrogenase [Microbacterium sp. YY-03]|uniref:zinc-binding alcohol dehydrogenase n=1 Tax=Microbacterium sp. YY-03 TaxID=3421636 RepID=UPI003D1861DE
MSEEPQSRWVIREEASHAVIIALYVRQALGIRGQHDLPTLRNAPIANPIRSDAEHDALERQWRSYWEMTVEPRAHTHSGPLDLVDGFDDFVALPITGANELRAAMVPLAAAAMAYATQAGQRYFDESSRRGGEARRPYVNAISMLRRTSGRSAQDFELNVEVLPLSQRGVWWIGSLTIAITDSVRSDVVAFDSALAAVVDELG